MIAHHAAGSGDASFCFSEEEKAATSSSPTSFGISSSSPTTFTFLLDAALSDLLRSRNLLSHKEEEKFSREVLRDLAPVNQAHTITLTAQMDLQSPSSKRKLHQQLTENSLDILAIPPRAFLKSSNALSRSCSLTKPPLLVPSLRSSDLAKLPNEPESKRRKLSVMQSRARLNWSLANLTAPVLYTREPASLRKAKSLRSESSCSSQDIWNTALSSDHILGTPFPRSSLPPTRPISPAAVTRPSTPDVPIIAPPPSNEITRASSSREDAAEARLTILLSKERRQRLEDGLADIPGDENVSGCGRKLKMQALDWMIDVRPKKPSGKARDDLFVQLTTSGETKFMAAYMFSRFMFKSGFDKNCEEQEEGVEQYTWDVAIACVALSVKMLRDVLWPLNPVSVRDFRRLALHKLSYNEFELAQKDVLEAFSYEMNGNTPQPFLDELWSSLPALQTVVGLQKKQKEAFMGKVWARLYDTLLDPGILNIPISVIVVCILEEVVPGHVAARYRQYVLTSEAKEGLVVGIRRFVEDMHDVMHLSKEVVYAGREWLRNVETVFGSPVM